MTAWPESNVALVLQPGFVVTCAATPVAASGTLLLSSAPV
jgi:hypothetical protein